MLVGGEDGHQEGPVELQHVGILTDSTQEGYEACGCRCLSAKLVDVQSGLVETLGEKSQSQPEPKAMGTA